MMFKVNSSHSVSVYVKNYRGQKLQIVEVKSNGSCALHSYSMIFIQLYIFTLTAPIVKKIIMQNNKGQQLQKQELSEDSVLD